MSVAIEGPPQHLEAEHSTIFTNESLKFLGELVEQFEKKVEDVLLQREKRRLEILEGKWRPRKQAAVGGDWTIADIPQRIRNRKLDLGDVSPANTTLFTDALHAEVQGIQVKYTKTALRKRVKRVFALQNRCFLCLRQTFECCFGLFWFHNNKRNSA